MSKLPDAWRRVEGPDIQAWANANSVALLGIDGVVSVGCEYSNEPPFPVPIPDKWATLPLEVLADILRAAGYLVLAPSDTSPLGELVRAAVENVDFIESHSDSAD